MTDVLKELHRIVNDAIRTADTGNAPPEPRLYDLSKIDLKKLSEEFAKKVKRKASALQDIRKLVEEKLKAMLARNPSRMDYYKKYSEIIADYNDHLFRHLPTPPFCESEKQQAAQRVYLHIWQQSAAGLFPGVAA